MTTTSDMARLLMMQGTQVPDAGLGPVTNTTRAGRPNPMLTAPSNQERPADYMQPVAELLSLPMGAYGAGQLVGSGINAAREGDYASGAGQVALGMAGMLPMAPKGGKGIRAFHGSPHDFDKFSMDAIGTGEGAQAYGHGLYFAEAEDVARYYRDQISGRTGNTQTAQGAADRALELTKGDKKAALDWIDGQISAMDRQIEAMQAKGMNVPAVFADRITNEYLPARDLVEGGYKPGGHMYEVNIKADPESFIDYDRPLGQQSEAVRRALDEAGLMPYTVVDQAGNRLDFSRGMPKAEAERFAAAKGGRAIPKDDADFDAVRKAQMMTGRGDAAQADIATALREAGIPGVRYLDQMSRGEGKGSSNYVVFDDNLIEILRKYGLLGPVAGGGTLAGMLMGGQEGETY